MGFTESIFSLKKIENLKAGFVTQTQSGIDLVFIFFMIAFYFYWIVSIRIGTTAQCIGFSFILPPPSASPIEDKYNLIPLLLYFIIITGLPLLSSLYTALAGLVHKI